MIRLTCFLEQGVDRHRDRQIALTGSGNADAKNEIVRRDRVEVFALVCGLRCNLLLSRTD